MTHLKQFQFTHNDQLAFAALSGDYNPMHVDPVAARRMLFGAQVVHGINSLLHSLDCWIGCRKENITLRTLKCEFFKPIRVGEVTHLVLEKDDGQRVKMCLYNDGSVATNIEFEWAAAPQNLLDSVEMRLPEKVAPRALTMDEMDGKSGTLNLCLEKTAATKIYPNLTGRLPSAQMTALLASARLVGVECPGLHSVYSEISLLANDQFGEATFKYEVTKIDKRFSLSYMAVKAPGLSGTVKAFVRPPPQDQETYIQLKNIVTAGEFAGQRALVIGGSRGLGEVTAKLLASGGADVKITFNQGQGDALRVVKEVSANGGLAGSLQCDVMSIQKATLEKELSNWVPTHLYYFATPHITPGKKGVFSNGLFNKFCGYYVTGISNMVDALKGKGLIKVFYPSSIFVDAPPVGMGEYAAAKMAGEMVCKYLESANVKFYCPRLPRMGTDQTVSLMPVSKAPPAPIMLDHLRSFHSSH